MTVKELNNALSERIKPSLVKTLLKEYQSTKSAHWLSDIPKTLIHAGLFCEACVSCLLNISDPDREIDLNNIRFEQCYKDLLNLPKKNPEEELLYLLIPNALKAAYTIRNKKKVVHIKINNAEEIDAELVVTICNWVMSQFIALYYTKNSVVIENLINATMERKIPTIEQFEDGKMMILKKLGFREQLLLILYHIPGRITTEELNDILKPKKKSYVGTYLGRLYKDRLVHFDKDGATITKNGVKEIETNTEKFFKD